MNAVDLLGGAVTTGIEWTDETWNPLVGCSWISPGCDGCYAARDTAGRLQNVPLYHGLAVRKPGQGPRFTGEIRFADDRLDQPLKWSRPRRIFVNSMSDLFHAKVPAWRIADIFAVMRLAEQHQFQVLTKRPERMARLLAGGVDAEAGSLATRHGEPVSDFEVLYRSSLEERGGPFFGYEDLPVPNVWLGTSIESQDWVDRRLGALMRAPAAKRFLSIEPLLGPVDLTRWLTKTCPTCEGSCSVPVEGGGKACPDCYPEYGTRQIQGLVPAIDWVIVGGESGPDARPMHPSWVRSLRLQCRDAGVPFLFKQWGEYVPADQLPGDVSRDRLRGVRIDEAGLESPVSGTLMFRPGKKAAGRVLDGRIWDEMPA